MDWNTGTKSGLVNIGTHSLELTISGPNRQPGEPAVIIFPGLGCGTTGWAAVLRLLQPFLRIITYERSGYGNSEISDEEPRSTVIAKELDALLKSANVQGSFILVGHSWGGVLSREFLGLRKDDIVGCVFVDANQEHTLEVVDWRKLGFSPVVAGISTVDDTGVQERSKLTAEEWVLYRETEMSQKHQRQAAKEFEVYADSFPILKQKQQLNKNPPNMSNKPVYVLKGDTRTDFEKSFAIGVQRGQGTQEERRKFLEDLKEYDKEVALQREMLSLSGMGKFVEIKNVGHYVNLTAPDGVVEGVRWVLEHLSRDS